MNRSSGYLGSSEIQTSKANHEIIPNSPSNWTVGYSLKKFSFDNSDECTVIINKDARIFLKAGQGFEIGYQDTPIHSFVIVESGVKFNWIGGY